MRRCSSIRAMASSARGSLLFGGLSVVSVNVSWLFALFDASVLLVKLRSHRHCHLCVHFCYLDVCFCMLRTSKTLNYFLIKTAVNLIPVLQPEVKQVLKLLKLSLNIMHFLLFLQQFGLVLSLQLWNSLLDFKLSLNHHRVVLFYFFLTINVLSQSFLQKLDLVLQILYFFILIWLLLLQFSIHLVTALNVLLKLLYFMIVLFSLLKKFLFEFNFLSFKA